MAVFSLACLATLAPVDAAAATPSLTDFTRVDIPDANLRAAINAQLASQLGTTRTATAAITVAELQQLTGLAAARQDIRALTGLEHATNLTKLVLDNVPVTSVAPLANLTQLRTLHLAGAQLADIRPLQTLTGLRILNLHDNQIEDISPLNALTGLDYLRLDNNQIQDIRPLRNLQSLRFLTLRNNRVSDISTLLDLASLYRLSLRGNPLNYAATGHIETLRGRMHLEFTPTTNDVPIPDPLLRARINKALGSERAADATITEAEMLSLTRLVVSARRRGPASQQITDIRGLSYARNLTSLGLSHNNITDLTPLAGLTKLTHLALNRNLNLTDISPLAGLTNLTHIDIWRCNVNDISPLRNLVKLARFPAKGNPIADISTMQNWTALRYTDIGANEKITNLGPLVANPGINSPGGSINITGNAKFSYEAIYTQIAALKANRVRVTFDNRVPGTLTRHGGNVQSGIIGECLATPLSVLVKDANEQPFEGVPVTWAVTFREGTVSHATSKTDADGIATTEFTLCNTPGANAVTATVSHPGTSLSTGFISLGKRRVGASTPAQPPAPPVVPPQQEATDDDEGTEGDDSGGTAENNGGNSRRMSPANVQYQRAEGGNEANANPPTYEDVKPQLDAYLAASLSYNTEMGKYAGAIRTLYNLQSQRRDVADQIDNTLGDKFDNYVDSATTLTLIAATGGAALPVVDLSTPIAGLFKNAAKTAQYWGYVGELADINKQIWEQYKNVLKPAHDAITKGASNQEDGRAWYDVYAEKYDALTRAIGDRSAVTDPSLRSILDGIPTEKAANLPDLPTLTLNPILIGCRGGGCELKFSIASEEYETTHAAYTAAMTTHFVECAKVPHAAENSKEGITLEQKIGHYSCVASKCTQFLEHHLICRGDLGKPDDGEGCDTYFPPKLKTSPYGPIGGGTGMPIATTTITVVEGPLDENHRCNQLAERDDDTDHAVEGPFVSCKSEGDDHYNCQGERTCVNDNKHAIHAMCGHTAPKYATEGSGRHAKVSNGQCPYVHPTRGWRCQRIGYYRCKNRHGRNPQYGHQYTGTGSPSQDPQSPGGGDGEDEDGDGDTEEGSPPGRGPQPLPREQPTGDLPTETPPTGNPPTGNPPTGNPPTEDPAPKAPPITTLTGDCGHTYLSTQQSRHARHTGRCPTTITYNGRNVQCTRRGYYRCAYKHGSGSTGGHQFATAQVTFPCGETGQYQYRSRHTWVNGRCPRTRTVLSQTLRCTRVGYYRCMSVHRHTYPRPSTTTGECGHAYYLSQAAAHARQASCSTSITQNGKTVYCTVTNYYACLHGSEDHVFPVPPPPIVCGNPWRGDSACDRGLADVSATTEHRFRCDAGHPYWHCNPSARAWHATTHNCTRPGCNQQYTNCSKNDGSCSGGRYTWHDDTPRTNTGGGGGVEDDPPPRTYRCSRCRVTLRSDVSHAVSHSCGNTYYSCNPSGVSWHETSYTCTRPGCGSSFTRCTMDTGNARSCRSNGRNYRWHNK